MNTILDSKIGLTKSIIASDVEVQSDTAARLDNALAEERGAIREKAEKREVEAVSPAAGEFASRKHTGAKKMPGMIEHYKVKGKGDESKFIRQKTKPSYGPRPRTRPPKPLQSARTRKSPQSPPGGGQSPRKQSSPQSPPGAGQSPRTRPPPPGMSRRSPPRTPSPPGETVRLRAQGPRPPSPPGTPPYAVTGSRPHPQWPSHPGTSPHAGTITPPRGPGFTPIKTMKTAGPRGVALGFNRMQTRGAMKQANIAQAKALPGSSGLPLEF
eukprot:GHVN01063960.1.p1 GENE.GHVN01063960.1~~GHVN01063960.1.p1  ORF type:complete len:269 (+),score=38.14 GHVN01063960.1:775-1581(+)